MHNQLRDRVHAANVEAGWWNNLQTGESILETRNRPEMMLLTVSELCEAVEGDMLAPDSHLPQYPTLHVELADAAIRTLDQAGADKIDLETSNFTAFDRYWFEAMVITLASRALEGYRKGRTEVYHENVALFYHQLFEVAEFYEFDLLEVIEAKLTYNANRADHKIENRKADGGKKI